MAITNTSMGLSLDPPQTGTTALTKQGDIEITLNEKHQVVQHLDGAFSVLVNGSDEVVVNSVSPAESTDGTDLINGAMVNPMVNTDHAFDERTNSGFDDTKATNFPATLTAGDTLVVCTSDDLGDGNTRRGVATEFTAIHAVSSLPGESTFSVPAVHWSGRSGVTSDSIDVSSFVSGLPSYSTTNQTPPSYETIINSINRYSPVTWMRTGSASFWHYQEFLPHDFGSGGTNTNFGREANATINPACLALISDAYTSAQKEAIATAIISHGIQWGDVMENSSTPSPEGGHFQTFGAVIAAARSARGRRLSTVVQDFGGNFAGCFQVTQTLLDKLAPSADNKTPYPFRLRDVVSVNETTVTVKNETGDGTTNDPSPKNFTNMIMTRPSDGATATVTSGSLNANENIPCTIDAQPSPAFAVDDEIYFDLPFTVSVGDYDWAIKGVGTSGIHAWNPMPEATYRNNNKWLGQVLLMAAAGWGGDTDALFGYVNRAQTANQPTSTYDYPTQEATTWESEFYAEHGASILT